MSSPRTIHAAGTVPWRVGSGGLEVALVHRPRYDDWAWPKGKLDPGERSPLTAVRETWEETGLRVRLGVPLPTADYATDGASKTVDYWAAEVVGGDGVLTGETDDVRWHTPPKAARALSYERDAQQLDGVTARFEDGALATVPFVLVRHALAVPRKRWKKRDQKRPLSEEGVKQAKDLPPLLAAYDVRRLVSSSSERCATTFRWASKALITPVRLTDRLTEEGFLAKPRAAARALDEVTRWSRTTGQGAALCTHGPLLATLLGHLAADADAPVAKQMTEAGAEGILKGESLVVHMVVNRNRRRIVGFERHRP